MALTRFLPNPSDRMGILWSLLQINDAVILEYGTKGTTAYAMKIFSMMGMDTSRLFATGFDENSVVMGDTSDLESKIIELDKKFTPKVIFVMASSVSSMTGSDVKGVCAYMREKVSAKIIVFTQGGFNGDYSSGLESCYTDLVTNLSIHKVAKENCYNILGVSAMEKTAKDDVLAIQKMILENFNLTANAVLSFETDLGKIETMSKAQVNIVLSYESLKAAKILEERFGTPYVYGYPIGENSTNTWLSDIATKIGASYDMKEAQSNQKIDKNVIIYADFDKALAIKKYVEELGATNIETICKHKIKKQDGIRYIPIEKEKIDVFKHAKNAIVFADATLLQFVDNSNTKIHTEDNSLLGNTYNYNIKNIK